MNRIHLKLCDICHEFVLNKNNHDICIESLVQDCGISSANGNALEIPVLHQNQYIYWKYIG